MEDRAQPQSCWGAVPDLLRVPKWWFLDPVRASMRKLVRPCTGLTRRKQLTLKYQMPTRCFYELMSPLMDGEVEGLQRDNYGRLLPTKLTKQLRRYSYVLRRGSLVDRFFALHKFEKPLAGLRNKPWRRCLGSARLFLGAAKQRRGMTASVMACVCGNVVIEFSEPTGFRSMPRLTIKMFVLSMDQEGNIIWPVDFDVRSRAALRKQTRALLGKMIEDKEYPVGEAMRPALTNTKTKDVRLAELQRPTVAVPVPAVEATPMQA